MFQVAEANTLITATILLATIILSLLSLSLLRGRSRWYVPVFCAMSLLGLYDIVFDDGKWYTLLPIFFLAIFIVGRDRSGWVFILPALYLIPYYSAAHIEAYTFLTFHEMICFALGVTLIIAIIKRDIGKSLFLGAFLLFWECYVLACQTYTVYALHIVVFAYLIQIVATRPREFRSRKGKRSS